MREYDRENVINVVKAALPGVTVDAKHSKQASLKALVAPAVAFREAGAYWENPFYRIWMNVDSDDAYIFSVSREHFPLTSRERDYLSNISEALEFARPHSTHTDNQQFQRLASRVVFPTAVVAKFLHNRKDRGFWNPAFLLLTLQELSSQSYEGGGATSGFVVVSKEQDLNSQLINDDYEIVKFENPIKLRDNFFVDPVSYRYVDGRNAFYLINRGSNIFGIAKIKDPLKWSLSDRLMGDHIRPLLSKMTGKTWAAMVGNQRDLQIITRVGPELRWARSKWQFLHMDVLVGLLNQHLESEKVSRELIKALWSMSLMRIGTLILIPSGESRPDIISDSANSDLQSEISKSIEGINISNLVKGAGLFGILGTDGLTTISRDGTIESSGKIIALSQEVQTEAGGGRTQAALACSVHGLAVKVSEDGPITFFRNGNKILKTNG